MSAALQRASQTADPAEQLKELLIAWRELRHPRIAELIERVSARALEGKKPFKGKSVPDRVKLVQAACESGDPVEVARVLATEWPGTWQTALPMLEAILKVPHDPRVAKELARQVDLMRYDTWTSDAFFRPLFAKLDAIGDVRQLPLLEAQSKRAKSHYYQQEMRFREDQSVRHHRDLKLLELTAEVEELLKKLEEPYAGAAAIEKSAKRSGADLLEAVLANPDDPAARVVYGDWLTEQGDPRGELISLQLGPQSDKSQRRQQTLIKKHWKTWLGPIADWLREAPDFEAGFPCFGRIDSPISAKGGDLAKVLEQREWRTFRGIHKYWSSAEELLTVVQHPNMKQLRSLAELHPSYVGALAATGLPLTRLAIHSNVDEFDFEPGVLKKLPKLEELSASPKLVRQLEPALGPLKLFSFSFANPPGDDLWPVLERMNIEAVHVRYYLGGSAKVTRARPGGPFTTARLESAGAIDDLLKALPTTLTEIVSDGVPRVATHKSRLDHLEPFFARFPSLKRRELPLELAPERPYVPHVELRIHGVAFFDEKMIAPVLKILTEKFAVPFDTFDARGELALGDDPVAKLTKWVNNKRCRDRVWISVKGTPTRASFERPGGYSPLEMFELPLTDASRFLAALEALVEFSKPTRLSVKRDQRHVSVDDMSTWPTKREEVRALLAAEAKS